MSDGEPGRPPWAPTKADRSRAEIAAGGGMPHEEIALALGVSVPTLRKHLAAELSTGAHRRRMQVLEAVHASARKGNAAAAKAYLSAVPEVAAPDVPKPVSTVETTEPLGKKAQAHEDAKTAQVGTGWESILPGGASSRIQ